MSPKFKKCPFCGSEVEIWTEEDKQDFPDPEFDPNAFHFACSNVVCLANDLFSTNWASAEEAAAAWNMRPEEGA